MPAVPSLVRYRKVVNWGLTPQAVNFAQSSFMGHRVCFSVPVDFMNQYLTWSRYSGELRPTGRFNNDPNSNGFVPKFSEMIERCLNSAYMDADGVASGLNYSSDALDATADMKRDQCVDNLDWDYTTLAANPPTQPTSTPLTTHYSANDLVMAFVLNKCFGSSAFDAYGVVYNLDDGFGMLTSAQLAEAIRASLAVEDSKAAAVTMPAMDVSAQNPGDDKGQVDAMFRSLLSIDPQRFYRNGRQITGLFETNYIATETRFTGTIDATGALTVVSVISGSLIAGARIETNDSSVALPADAVLGGSGPSSWTVTSVVGGTIPTVLSAVEFHLCTDLASCVGSVSGGVLTVTRYLLGTQLTSGAFLSGPGVPSLLKINVYTQAVPPGVNGVGDSYTLQIFDNVSQLYVDYLGTINLGAVSYFTTPTADPDAAGNWCLAVGDKIEIPVRLYFRAPVTVLSVVDGAKNASSATPDQVETVFIKGENGAAFDSSNADNVSAADRGNVMAVRLQILCSAPLISALTLASSEDSAVPMNNQVANFANPIFYQGAHYPTQTAMVVVYAGSWFDTTAQGYLPPTLTSSPTIAGLTATLVGTACVFTFDPTIASPLTSQSSSQVVAVTLTSASNTPLVKNITVTISAPPPQ